MIVVSVRDAYFTAAVEEARFSSLWLQPRVDIQLILIDVGLAIRVTMVSSSLKKIKPIYIWCTQTMTKP